LVVLHNEVSSLQTQNPILQTQLEHLQSSPVDAPTKLDFFQLQAKVNLLQASVNEVIKVGTSGLDANESDLLSSRSTVSDLQSTVTSFRNTVPCLTNGVTSPRALLSVATVCDRSYPVEDRQCDRGAVETPERTVRSASRPTAADVRRGMCPGDRPVCPYSLAAPSFILGQSYVDRLPHTESGTYGRVGELSRALGRPEVKSPPDLTRTGATQLWQSRSYLGEVA
jgi:hypothetical protein